MNTRRLQTLVAVAVAGLCNLAAVSAVDAGVLNRRSSDELFFGGEFSTSLAALPPATGGAAFFTKTVLVPPNVDSLYITITTTGDTHGGAALRLACRTRIPPFTGFSPCLGGPGSADGSPSGWITLNKVPVSPGTTNCDDGGGGNGDCHDNTVAYQFCRKIKPTGASASLREVELRLASSIAGQTVFFEKASIYVDANVGSGGTCPN